MSLALSHLKFKFLSNDQRVYVLTARPVPLNSLNKHPFNTKQTFGNTRFYTVPYESFERGNDQFNVLVGYTRKHDGDLARIACAPKEQEVELSSMILKDVRQVAAALCLPVVVIIGNEDRAVDDIECTRDEWMCAYFHDPRQRKSNEELFIENESDSADEP